MPYVSLWGADSMVQERRYDLIGSPQQLAEVWSEHDGRKDSYSNEARRPDVDFGRCLVVVIFGGGSGNTYGIECKGILDDGETVRFRYKNRWYQVIIDSFRELVPDDRGRPSVGDRRRGAAYGFFVIPRTEKPIVIEEDIAGMIGAPPVWKERARLDPKAAR